MSNQTAERMQIKHVPIDSLKPDPANPRKISNAELEALTRSLREWGFVQPVIALRKGRSVVGGHQRLLAARRLGIKTVPVIFVDLSLEQARLLNLALNKISGEWDEELLARMLADLQGAEAIDLSLSGFSEGELDKLLKSLDVREKRERPEQFDVDAALEAAKKERTAEVVQTDDGVRYRLDDGTEHKSPSSAGKAAMGGVACNGWRFWSLEGDAKPARAAKAKAAKAAKAKAAPKKSGKAKKAKKGGKAKGKAVKSESRASYGCAACGAEFPSLKAATEHAMGHTS
jgi:ParB-like chromosome segregation protein Spo0J